MGQQEKRGACHKCQWSRSAGAAVCCRQQPAGQRVAAAARGTSLETWSDRPDVGVGGAGASKRSSLLWDGSGQEGGGQGGRPW
jgi:hypothetical protein